MLRFWRFHSFSVNARFRVYLFSSEPIPSEALPDYLSHGQPEAVVVVHPLTVVVAKALLIDVAKQVKGFDADIGSAQPALQ